MLSRNNADKQREPEMHSAKIGEDRLFKIIRRLGLKTYCGTRTKVPTQANVQRLTNYDDPLIGK